MRPLIALCGTALGVTSSPAQTVAYDDEMLAISLGAAPGTLDLSWFGHTGRSYFLMYSPTLATGSWSYLPIIEPGADATLSYGASTPGEGERFFARTVVMPSTSTQPRFADFDNDGVSNMDELQAGLDPLASVDSEPDEMPDDWETFYFGDISRDGTGDYDGDGVSDAAEYAAGRRPNSSIVYGTVTYVWAGEDTSTKTVFFRDEQNQRTDNNCETVILVRYTDAALTRAELLQIYYGQDLVQFLAYYHSDPQPGWFAPTVEYTLASTAPDEQALVFSGQSTWARTAQDLLRKIDGRPYAYVNSPTAKRVPAYLAITSTPLTSVNTADFPAILRDFP